MNDTPHIPAQFIAPNPYQDWHDPETVQPASDTNQSGFASTPDRHDFDAPERDAEAAAATPAAATPHPEASEDADAPQPLAAGTYALYDDQSGGYVLVIGTREGDTHHKHIPARIVKMAETVMGGNSPLAGLFG